MSQKRFVTWNGKYDTTNTKDTFGLTIKDGNTTPNVLQITTSPQSSSPIQMYRFVYERNAAIVAPATSVAAQTLIPDLTLITTLYYQFTADITVVATHDTSVNDIGTFRLTGTSLANALGGNSFTCIMVTHSDDMRAYLSETDIVLNVTSNKFNIIISPQSTVGNVSYINIIADVSITGATLTQS